jgi:periplasmic divalent cation tolerance protein
LYDRFSNHSLHLRRSRAGRTHHHRLLELHLAACINIVPGVQSIYRWQGSIESSAEVLLLIKTRATLIREVQATIAGLHSYDVPEFLVLSVAAGSEAYLAWLEASLR